MNDINTANKNLTAANTAFSRALNQYRDIVPQVERTCPCTGTKHFNPCDEYWALVYGQLTSKKWAAILKVAPVVAAITAEAEAVFAAQAVAKAAREAEKARKAAAKAEREAKATYRATHGARPEEKGLNPYAAGNYDVLSGALTAQRAEFLGRFVDAAEAAAKKAGLLDRFSFAVAADAGGAEFDGYVAKLATKIEARITAVVALTGNLWDGSVLTVDTEAGRQAYRTTCKLNARYGYNARNGHYTGYYQWPTQRLA